MIDIIFDYESEFEDTITELEVVVPDTPNPTPAPTPTRCTGDQTYDENLNALFLDDMPGVYIVKQSSNFFLHL